MSQIDLKCLPTGDLSPSRDCGPLFEDHYCGTLFSQQSFCCFLCSADVWCSSGFSLRSFFFSHQVLLLFLNGAVKGHVFSELYRRCLAVLLLWTRWLLWSLFIATKDWVAVSENFLQLNLYAIEDLLLRVHSCLLILLQLATAFNLWQTHERSGLVDPPESTITLYGKLRPLNEGPTSLTFSF